ncbi:hypothetical protein [Anaerosporobacter sp.]|nr:hypothetical protein [Anaerosporobacter sp.]
MIIREGTVEDYYAVDHIAKQVQELHVEFILYLLTKSIGLLVL